MSLDEIVRIEEGLCRAEEAFKQGEFEEASSILGLGSSFRTEIKYWNYTFRLPEATRTRFMRIERLILTHDCQKKLEEAQNLVKERDIESAMFYFNLAAHYADELDTPLPPGFAEHVVQAYRMGINIAGSKLKKGNYACATGIITSVIKHRTGVDIPHELRILAEKVRRDGSVMGCRSELEEANQAIEILNNPETSFSDGLTAASEARNRLRRAESYAALVELPMPQDVDRLKQTISQREAYFRLMGTSSRHRALA